MFRRAEFIWIDTQPIEASGSKSIFFGGAPRCEGLNRWIYFRRRVQVPSSPKHASVKIAADGRYMFYANGNLVGRGPVRASPHFMRTTEFDLTPFLVAGENWLAALVHAPGVSLSNYQRLGGEWSKVFGDGGLYCEVR